MNYLIFMALLKFTPTNPPGQALQLQLGKWGSLSPAYFFRSTDGSPADYPTGVSLMADEQFLHVKFDCEKDEFVLENYMTGHNEPLYNQEVFELFIAASEADPSQYLEFEINPNDAIWVGKIINPGLGDSGGISTEMIGHEASGIRHEATIGNGRWGGSFSIPWVLVSTERQAHYRINFYRIVSKKSQPEKTWACDADNAEFLCWNSTMSGAEPAFHRPRRFGSLVLVE